MNKGLTPKTEEVLLSISKLDFIKEFILVGGSALSLQLHARYSEDLDFMRWKKFRIDRLFQYPHLRLEKYRFCNINIKIFNHEEIIFSFGRSIIFVICM